jgi:hypothetical protein
METIIEYLNELKKGLYGHEGYHNFLIEYESHLLAEFETFKQKYSNENIESIEFEFVLSLEDPQYVANEIITDNQLERTIEKSFNLLMIQELITWKKVLQIVYIYSMLFLIAHFNIIFFESELLLLVLISEIIITMLILSKDVINLLKLKYKSIEIFKAVALKVVIFMLFLPVFLILSATNGIPVVDFFTLFLFLLLLTVIYLLFDKSLNQFKTINIRLNNKYLDELINKRIYWLSPITLGLLYSSFIWIIMKIIHSVFGRFSTYDIIGAIITPIDLNTSLKYINNNEFGIYILIALFLEFLFFLGFLIPILFTLYQKIHYQYKFGNIVQFYFIQGLLFLSVYTFNFILMFGVQFTQLRDYDVSLLNVMTFLSSVFIFLLILRKWQIFSKITIHTSI